MTSNPDTRIVEAVAAWPSNAELIADVAALHLTETVSILDLTYGRGGWWRVWQPPELVTNDLYTEARYRDDFRSTRWIGETTFDAVAFDPPYKLNGTPALGDFDDRYGVDQPMPWQDRMQLILDGFVEAARIVRTGGTLLAKCQDQVVSGQMRWQTIMLATALPNLRLVDRFDMLGGGRPQPAGRQQKHAYNRPSTLLVFKKERPQ